MTQLSALINQLQQAEIAADAGALPVCLADWQGGYQVPQETTTVQISFENYKDANGQPQIGNIVKLG